VIALDRSKVVWKMSVARKDKTRWLGAGLEAEKPPVTDPRGLEIFIAVGPGCSLIAASSIAADVSTLGEPHSGLM